MDTPTQLWKSNPPWWHLPLFTLLSITMGLVMGVLVGKVDKPVLLVGAALGMVVVLLTLVNVEFGLMVFVAITYLRLSDILVHDYDAPSIARPFIFLLIVAIILRWAITGNIPKGWMLPGVLGVAYGLVVFGSIFTAVDFSSAQYAISDYWKDGLIMVLMAVLIQRKETFRSVIWTLLAAGTFLGSISVYQYLTGTFSNDYWGFALAPVLNIVDGTESNRVAGPIGDPNFYAQVMVVLVPIAINRMLKEKTIYLKALAAYASIVITLAVILTFSRGGTLALVAALVAFAFYRPPRISMVLAMIGLFWIVALVMPSTFLERMSTVTDLISGAGDVREEVSFRGRASEMLSAWLMFADHPVLGVGTNNYQNNYQYYSRQLGLDPRAEARNPHSLYLQIAAETGMLGILVFGAIIYSIFRGIHYARREFIEIEDEDFADLAGAFSAGMIGYLAASLFVHMSFMRYFWLLTGIAMSLPEVARSAKYAFQEKKFSLPGGRVGRQSAARRKDR